MRASVWYATGLDCNTTRKTMASESPEMLRKLSLLSALKDMQGQFLRGHIHTRMDSLLIPFLNLLVKPVGQPLSSLSIQISWLLLDSMVRMTLYPVHSLLA